jgi:hypothetical protein
MWRKLAAGLVSGSVLVAFGVTADAGTQLGPSVCLRLASVDPSCPGRVEFDPGGSVTPKKLPTHELAPVGLEIHGEIAMENGGHPPALRETIVDVPENVAIDATGLPACRLRQLEGRGIGAARRLCRKAIVGSGVAGVGFASSGTTVEAPLTLFNGGTSGGETRVFVHGAIAVPDPIPMVGTVKIQRKYPGLHTIWKIPRILEGDGSLLDFRFKIERRFMSRETEHSYIAARCTDKGLLVNLPVVTFRNEAHAPGQASATMLKGGFALPCSPGG